MTVRLGLMSLHNIKDTKEQQSNKHTKSPRDHLADDRLLISLWWAKILKVILIII